jgi:RING finger protein 113A
MFKKPKKNPKDKFRTTKRSFGNESNDGNVVNDEHENNPKRFRKTAKHESSDDEDDDDNELSTFQLLEQTKHDQKGQNQRGLLTASSSSRKSGPNLMYDFKSSDKHDLSGKDMATRTAEFHPEVSVANKDDNHDNTVENTSSDTKLYKGTKEKRNKFLAGPLKAPTFVRTTARFDYQPDICKDYKETGFCGFGDSCIYLHDRGNTLSGWQLEEEYEKKKKEEQEKKQKEMDLFCLEISKDNMLGANQNEASGPSEDGIPFACFLCRSAFVDPVVTVCSHYFCQKCILDHVQSISSGSSASCPICKKDTNGVFNHPTKLFTKKRRLLGNDASWEEFFNVNKSS